MTGCGACHALPVGEWCDFHERTLRAAMDRADAKAHGGSELAEPLERGIVSVRPVADNDPMSNEHPTQEVSQ